MKKYHILSFAASFSLLLIIPVIAFGTIGVGVGSGKIIMNEELNPGSTYYLPSIPVINTGDEPSNYGMEVDYFENQPEMKPDKSWFSFDPSTPFHLKPGQSRTVAVKLSLPVKMTPGKYFAFLETHPVQDVSGGGVAIGVAAASKLYFTVAPSNIFQGIYYKTVSFFRDYAPWTYIILAMLVGVLLIILIRKYFKFNISIGIGKK